MSERLLRARQSLLGLAVGDALGAFFEFSQGRLSRRVRAGAHWREATRQLFGETGSYGNGCASRVPPVGAFFADDLATAAKQAARSAVTTHAHPEALAGAAAVAGAAAWAWQLREIPSIAPGDFLERVAQHVPASAVRTGILRARDLAPTTAPAEAATLLGNGSDAAVQTTVPFALWCAAQQLTDYEEAIWLTLHGQGDCDTTCAIVGGVVVMRTGADAIPSAWREACEPLPQWAFED